MKLFSYIARDPEAAQTEGYVCAESAAAAQRQLEECGLTVLSVANANPQDRGAPRQSASLWHALGLLNFRLAREPEAWTDLRGTLQELSATDLPLSLSLAIGRWLSRTKGPIKLEDLAALYPTGFAPVYLALIHGDENRSGRLHQLGLHCMWRSEQRRRSVGVNTTASTALVIGLLLSLPIFIVFITGLFEDIFSMFFISLPVPTWIIMALGRFLRSPNVSTPIAILVIAVLTLRLVAGHGRITYMYQAVRWALSRFRGNYRSAHRAELCQVLALITMAGVRTPDMVRLAAGSCGNRYLRERLFAAMRSVSGGMPLIEALRGQGILPESRAWEIDAISRTRPLATALWDAGTCDAGRLQMRRTLMSQFVTLALIIVLLGVAITVISMFLPILSLGSLVS